MGAGTRSGGDAQRTGRPPSSSASTWFGLAAVGALLFGLGIWIPSWRGVPYAPELEVLFAAAGGILFVVGATYAVQAQRASRRLPIEEIPGVSVFRPDAPAVAGEPVTAEETR